MRTLFWAACIVALALPISAALAQDASEEIAVEYRDLPAAVGFDAATRQGAPQLHSDIPGNLAFEYESGDRAAVEAAFLDAIGAAGGAQRLVEAAWRHVGFLRVERRPPETTPGGKIQHLHSTYRPAASAGA